MLLDTVRKLLGWHASATEALFAATPTLLAPDIALAEDDDPEWPSARIGIAEALWGEGFLCPGGAAETLRLAEADGTVGATSSLLLVGAGSGGRPAASQPASAFWVSGFEANHRLAALASERSVRAGLGRRAQVETWDPLAPKFPLHYYHHGMAFEPFRGARPEPTLAAVSIALKRGGQLVLVELVADLKLDRGRSDGCRLDAARSPSPPDVPSELTITRVLGRLGFDVRIVEDISRRHMRQSVAGWLTAVQAMEDTRPTLHELALVGEARRSCGWSASA